MDDRPRLGPSALGLALAGLLVGHWITYVIVRPDAHLRAELLAGTGHGYLAIAIQVAWLLASICVGATILRRLVCAGPPVPTRRLASRLSGSQLGAFALLEVSERAVEGSFEGLVSVCAVGIVVQIVIGTLTARLLHRLLQLADVVMSVLGRTPSPRPAAPGFGAPVGASHPHGTAVVSAPGIRAPPSLVR